MFPKLLVLLLMCSSVGLSQSFNLDKVGKEKLLRYNGGINANSVFYDGTANRESLTYFVTGNLNFNIAGFIIFP